MVDAIYIHIPFCKRKCHYCDFYILTNMEKEYNNYVDHLIEEIRIYPKIKYDTIYFGGGTPSVLEVSDIKRILKELNYDDNTEITLELNPKDIIYEKLVELRKSGINRLSIGIQSFNAKHIEIMNRTHSVVDSIKTFYEARKAGFENITVDLIFALPNQKIEELEFDLSILKKLQPNHISIYSLIWENGTMFMKRLKEGKIAKLDEDLEADMFNLIIDKLESYGYEHYEISSFSKPNYKGRHNKKYWQNKEYIGVGISASGYVEGIRYENTRSLKKYYEMIDSKIKPIDSRTIEEIDDELFLKNEIILGFRMLDEGIRNNLIDEEIKKELIKKQYIYEKEDRIYLTKKGIFISNDILQNFI